MKPSTGTPKPNCIYCGKRLRGNTTDNEICYDCQVEYTNILKQFYEEQAKLAEKKADDPQKYSKDSKTDTSFRKTRYKLPTKVNYNKNSKKY